MTTRIQRVPPGKYETNDIRPRHEPRPDRPPFRTPRVRSSECVEPVTAEVLAKDGPGNRIVAVFGRSQRRCGFDRDSQGLPTCTAGIHPATSINPVDVAAGRSPAMSKTPPYKLGSQAVRNHPPSKPAASPPSGGTSTPCPNCDTRSLRRLQTVQRGGVREVEACPPSVWTKTDDEILERLAGSHRGMGPRPRRCTRLRGRSRRRGPEDGPQGLWHVRSHRHGAGVARGS